MTAVRSAYEARLEAGGIDRDPAQEAVVDLLNDLAVRLETRRKPWFGTPDPVIGLYIWGGVGRGKSMLMDLFYSAVSVEKKRRVHFHDFMIETHAFINDWRGFSHRERKESGLRVRGAGEDPIPPAAARIAERTQLLCFDEFQVTDIADAMLLGRLYDALQARGVTMVATSNRHPDDLYKNGLNRQLFEPFIETLKATNTVHELAATRDYRLERLQSAPVYYTPLDADAATAMDAAWDRLTLSAEPQRSHLSVQGREVVIPCEAAGCARFSFADLCRKPLGAADYLAIARRFHTVLVDDVPVMTGDERNEAARFVKLIDALYEAKTKLVMSAAAKPDALYEAGDGSFEFQRTASRLHEMASKAYLEAERIGGEESAE